MKTAATILAGIVAIIAILFALNWIVRWSSNVTTSVSIVQPAEGVRCALASTSNGVALSCDWGAK